MASACMRVLCRQCQSVITCPAWSALSSYMIYSACQNMTAHFSPDLSNRFMYTCLCKLYLYLALTSCALMKYAALKLKVHAVHVYIYI